MNKNTFFKTILSFLLVFAAVFTGCDDDKTKGPEAGGNKPATAYIRVTPATLTFDHTGAAVGGDTFTVESNCAWGVSVESGKTWVHLSATQGENNASVTVTIPEPVAEGDQAEITFVTTDALGTPASQKVTVVQHSEISELPVMSVTPASLEFSDTGEALAGNTFTVQSNCAWTVEVEAGKEWLQLSARQGTNDGSVIVTIPSATEVRQTAELIFTATNTAGVQIPRKVTVVQNAREVPPEPLPAGKIEIVVDFQLGANIATPELPPYTKEQAEYVTGRHEYKIEGYTFAIFADAAQSGKFYWIDNTQFNPDIPAPNKGLYFSKLGAYIEFPAIAGKKLSEVSYLPTVQQNASVDLLDTDDADTVEYVLDFDENGASVYTLINPIEKTSYRIEVVNTKNAQCAKLVLTYVDAE